MKTMKKAVALILLLSLALSVCGCKVSVRPDKYAFVSGDVYASIIPSSVKLERSEEIPKTMDKKFRFDIGRNDLGSAQFIFRDKVSEIGKISVEVGSFSNEKGETLPDGCFSAYREYFHPIPTISENTYYPDGLIPTDKVADEFKTEVGHNCALWFDAEVPLGTEAGLYTGVVTVSFRGTKFDIPVEINVLDVDIPLKASLDTYGAVFVRVREEFPGLPEEEWHELETDLREKLLRSRFTPSTLAKGHWDFETDEEYADYIVDSLKADDRITCLNIDLWQLERLKVICDILRENGVLDRCYIYTRDEPNSSMVPDICTYLDYLNEFIPDLKDLCPTNSVQMGLLGHLKFWCLSDVPAHNADLRRRIKETGATMWRYENESGQIADNSLAYTMAHFSETKEFDFDGMLIWSIYHSGTFDSYKEENLTLCRDMWNDVYCFLPGEIWDPRGGGATFFYPGQKGKGITNDNIICESIRLRYLREGGEYYELLTTREQQLKTAAEKAGIYSDALINELMGLYYSNAKNALDTQIDGVYSDSQKAYKQILTKTYEDILTFDENAPLISVVTDSNDTLFYIRYVTVYAPKGASVSVNGEETAETAVNENISKYTLTANCREARQDLNIKINEETVIKTVYAKSVDNSAVHSIFAEGGISEDDYNAVAKTSGNAVIGFENGNIQLDLRDANNVAKFRLKDLGHLNASELAGSTHIAVTMTNNTASFITSMSVAVDAGLARVEIPFRMALDPGKTMTVYIPLAAFYEKGAKITKVTRITIANSGSHAENFLVGISDIAFVKVD